jgi:1A family penicillin-binding protein
MCDDAPRVTGARPGRHPARECAPAHNERTPASMSARDDSRYRATASGRGPSTGGSARRTTGAGRPPAARGGARPPARGGRPGPRGPRKRWVAVVRVGLLVLLLAAVALGITGCVVYNSVADSLPDPTKPLRGVDQTTKVVDRNGAVITDLFAEQNRTNVALKDIPPVVRQAVIATEDERYYEHAGLDFIGMLRALVTDVKAGGAVAGGSTITQQYIKQSILTSERSIQRKVSEAILAYRIEQQYSKDQILEMYLNTIYFGHGAYGVQTAAKVYFGKDVGQITPTEAAVLAGVIKSPRRYSPYYDMAAATKRRDVVLGQMKSQGYIDEAVRAAAVAEPIKTVGLKRGSKVAPYFVEYLKELLVDQYGEQMVYRSGLRVKTTLDLKMQAAAESAVAKALNKASDPSASVVALDPKTGQILAMVGGRDFATQQFNVAVQGHRQTGSSFKPFVLVAAFQEGVSPEQTFESGPAKLPLPDGKIWSVTGASGGKKGPLRLRAATAASVNSVFAQLVLQVGADKVVKAATAMGIETKITPVPAVALGGMREGVTPIEMASAFGTLANAGTHMKPYGILEVKDASGKLLFSGAPAGTKAIEPAIAYLTTDLLKGVISGGTGKSAAIGRPAAGKTGTTQDNSDAWFVGYTPNLVAAVWVGYPAEMKPMNNVHGIAVTGGTFPAQIWAAFMKSAVKGLPKVDFKKPAGLTTEQICLETGGLATPYCPKKGSGLFLIKALPPLCTKHALPVTITVPNVIGMLKQDAIAALEKLLLKYAIQEKQISGVQPGVVADQDPKVGSQGTTSTVVTLVVSSGSAADKAPVAVFDYLPKPPVAGAPVKFDASASTDDGVITKWVWEFGDTKTDSTSGKVVSHTYPAGTYKVTLWITDDGAHTVSLTKSIVVK